MAAALTPEVASTLMLSGVTFGFVNSLHCAGMCGPLAVLFAREPHAAVGYHAARIVSYAGLGTLMGALGAAVGADRLGGGGAWLAIALAVFLLGFALGLDKHILRVPLLGDVGRRLTSRVGTLNGTTRALALGALTPLLPCGVLYAACLAALGSGGPAQGAIALAGLAIGAAPLMLLAQWRLGTLQRRLGPARMARVARAAMLIAALMLGWRGVVDLRSRTQGIEGACPMCETSTGG
ncbi:MAG: sulfite exporter TauE/SafE family protein [Planctomycetota bacterium]